MKINRFFFLKKYFCKFIDLVSILINSPLSIVGYFAHNHPHILR